MVVGMSNVCAKPTCTDSVEVWLDFMPGEQRVIERAVRGDASVGLCATHAERFTVPTGWTFERTTEQWAHTPDRPWFLALTDTPSEAVAEEHLRGARPAAHRDVQQTTQDDPVGATSEPTAGSLLHRAFHGPDRKLDAARAALDELEQRRAARIEDDGGGTIELPFPPFEPEHRVAVS